MPGAGGASVPRITCRGGRQHVCTRACVIHEQSRLREIYVWYWSHIMAYHSGLCEVQNSVRSPSPMSHVSAGAAPLPALDRGCGVAGRGRWAVPVGAAPARPNGSARAVAPTALWIVCTGRPRQSWGHRSRREAASIGTPNTLHAADARGQRKAISQARD